MYGSVEMSNRNTIDLICRIWEQAEIALRKEIQTLTPDIDEELITSGFYRLFNGLLLSASADREIERAFLYDLQASFPTDLEFAFDTFASGIIANVTLHDNRRLEGRTGGDLGFIVNRPSIAGETLGDYWTFRIFDFWQGLLCQCKLKSPAGWGKLTSSQQRVLPGKSSFLALLLYQYENSQRDLLAPFVWQVCEKMEIPEIAEALKAGLFPSPVSSSEVLNRLAHGEIGTSDPNFINGVIGPSGSRAIIIKIGWADGAAPSPPISNVYVQAKLSDSEVRYVQRKLWI